MMILCNYEPRCYTEFPSAAKGLPTVMQESRVRSPLFEGLPDELEVGRYHSWIIAEENFPGELEVTARDENNYIMALQHKTFDVQGVQFHPESVLTPDGELIMRNWLKPPTP